MQAEGQNRIYMHESREENLLAAKRAARGMRGARIMRRTGIYDDVIDILIGNDFLERHIFRMPHKAPPPVGERTFRIEGTAIYR